MGSATASDQFCQWEHFIGEQSFSCHGEHLEQVGWQLNILFLAQVSQVEAYG